MYEKDTFYPLLTDVIGQVFTRTTRPEKLEKFSARLIFSLTLRTKPERYCLKSKIFLLKKYIIETKDN